MFPSISDYISSIEGAADTLNALNYLRPVLKPNGQPFFSSGNFAVVFKMLDTRTSNHMALKCFLRDVPDRARRLRLIGEWIAENPSPYLLPMTYHADELWVDCAHCTREEFDVVMMPWVEGVTLGEYVRGLCGMIELDWAWRGMKKMTELASHFDELGRFLIEQPFAHGDIKPDNVIVLEKYLPEVDIYEIDIRLVDYDGCFVSALSGEKAIETGTPPYRHPDRNINHFDRHIDDFALLALSLELHSLTRERKLFVAGESLIFPTDFAHSAYKNPIWEQLRHLHNKNVSARAGLSEFALHTEPGRIEGLRTFWPNTLLPEMLKRVAPDSKPDTVLPRLRKTPSLELKPLTVNSSSKLTPYRQAYKWGFCNQNWEIIIECIYEDARPFSEELAAVKKKGKWGFIDIEGKTIIPLQHDLVGSFSEGITRAQLGGRFGLLDNKGQNVVPFHYDLIEPFSQGLASVLQYGKKGFIDKTGKVVIPLMYDFALPFSDGMAAVRLKDNWGYINKGGSVVLHFLYSSASPFSEGLAAVKKNGTYGYINKSGTIILPLKYDWTGSFSEGLAWVRHHWRFGFINKAGILVIPFQYDWASSFSEGLAAVQKNDEWGYIDQTGKVIIPRIYYKADAFSGGFARVGKNGVERYIDLQGKEYLGK